MTSKLALLIFLLVGIAACTHCQTERVFVVDAPDPDLDALLQTCLAADACVTAEGYSCTPPACLPACRRVAELANDTGAENSMKFCQVSRVPDGGTAVLVMISFDAC